MGRDRDSNPQDGQHNQYDGKYMRNTTWPWPGRSQYPSIHHDQGAKIIRTEAIQHMMNKLRLTGDIIANVGRHCWTCGAGRAELGGVYHKSSKCQLPAYDGEPHECQKGIFLMHEGKTCPYNNTIEPNKMED